MREDMSSMEDDVDGPLYHEIDETGHSARWDVGCDSEVNHPAYTLAIEMNKSHLPEEVRCPEVVTLLKLNIVLTVKVTVNNMADSRRTGSGSICYFSDTHDIFPCSHGDVNSCDYCHIPGCPYTDRLGEEHFLVTSRESSLTVEQLQRAHLAFRVSTNQHVVADEADARNCTIELFYHTDDRRGVIVAKGVCLDGVWEEQDKVHVVCVMDINERVVSLLREMRPQMRQLYAALPEDIKQRLIKHYAIIISHPHGRPKMVSVGRTLKTENKPWQDSLWYKETRYKVPTCVGCSGAPVVGPGWEDGGPGYRVHVGYFLPSNEQGKIGVSKSFWVVDSDPRGGILT
ncbi:hypothetical protein Btru_059853 [Bulinus truncatus]|nr:hypothetical protein Btru_059853 [Bulinus truncatus]